MGSNAAHSVRRECRATLAARSSGSSMQQQRNGNTASTSRSSGRAIKVAAQGFQFGAATAGQQAHRDAERAEKELARERRKKEQRLEELERGTGPSSSWNDSSSFNVPAASTSAAAIAGLLAGRQTEQEEEFDPIPQTQPSSHGHVHATAATAGAAASHASGRKKPSMGLKRLLTQRRSLKLLLEDASASPVFKNAPNNFLKSLHSSNRYPIHRATGPVCSICGYWGDIRCLRCHERVCGLNCSATHNETRCERPL